GICFDVCHLAVQFEDPTESLDKLEAAGIRIDRIQLSSAVDIEIEGDLDDNLERLRPFNEHVYLHQVVESSRLGGSDTVLRRFPDLPEALQALSQEGGFLHPRKWRIHFHLPLFLSETDEWGTTQNQVIDILESLQHKPRCRHLEVETYTWNVLPPELQTEDRVSDITRELEWVIGQMERIDEEKTESGRGTR
ncbi:MAG TPA: xylose isomerase, partial [Acidobacteriota bacterium]|nr:xylose isomerase [Acidobacteriota bacterium]